MTRVGSRLALVAAGVVTMAACVQPAPSTATETFQRSFENPIDAITEADIRRDIFALAGDDMRGREAGTLDELRASAWIAERAREAGMEPAGDDGTYFQWWSLRRTTLSDQSRIAVGDRVLALRREVMVTNPGNVSVTAPLTWVDDVRGDTARRDLAGRAAATRITTTAAQQLNATIAALRARGAAAIVIVGDSAADTDDAWSGVIQSRASRGSYSLDTGTVMPARPTTAQAVPVIRARGSVAAAIRQAAATGAPLSADIALATFSYPSVNVVARVPGTDPRLRSEHVLFSGHQDHDGIRPTTDGDSIWNGADDNATVSVAMLAIGRAVSARPMARTALFVWHGAEEKGLFGSKVFVMRPTVPLSSIVAVLNGDMMGRNHPDSAALLGRRAPYQNSDALAAAAMRANDDVIRFKLDTLWERREHREGWYCRSDHVPYANVGIPSIFFTTLLHPDYHTQRDDPETIDITKLTRMTRWMYLTGFAVGNAAERPDGRRIDMSQCNWVLQR